jgi:methylmalonyl-CoA epimerase
MIDLVNEATIPGVSGAGDLSLRLDHIGIAVVSIASARSVYGTLGICVGEEETVEREQVKAAIAALGESRIELLEPTAADSTIGRFLARRGEGIHHIALHTGDIEAKFRALKAQGVRLASDSIQTGAGGHKYFFVHPASAGGVLIEIVGDAPREQEPGQQEPGQQEPGQQEPGQQEPGQQEPGQQEPGQQEPGQQEPGQQEPGERGQV